MTEQQLPCVAATLIPEADPQWPASYHWCKDEFHHDSIHTCFCGLIWDQRTTPLTDFCGPEMIDWRRNSRTA